MMLLVPPRTEHCSSHAERDLINDRLLVESVRESPAVSSTECNILSDIAALVEPNLVADNHSADVCDEEAGADIGGSAYSQQEQVCSPSRVVPGKRGGTIGPDKTRNSGCRCRRSERMRNEWKDYMGEQNSDAAQQRPMAACMLGA